MSRRAGHAAGRLDRGESAQLAESDAVGERGHISKTFMSDQVFLYFYYIPFHVNLPEERDAAGRTEVGRAPAGPQQRGDGRRKTWTRYYCGGIWSSQRSPAMPRQCARRTQIGAVVLGAGGGFARHCRDDCAGALAAPTDGAAHEFRVRAHGTLADALRGGRRPRLPLDGGRRTARPRRIGRFAVEASPLAGSADLDANMTAGTIFCHHRGRAARTGRFRQESRSPPASSSMAPRPFWR